jgi:hypothetical protein
MTDDDDSKPGKAGPEGSSAPPAGDDAARNAPPLKKRPRRRKPNRQIVAKRKGQIDLGALLSEPLHVLKAGKVVNMDPVEAAIRKQVAKALKDRSVAAIKEVIDLAIKHGLVAEPPPELRGGVVVIPKTVSLSEQRAIFSHPGPPMWQILALLELHYDEIK